MNAYYQKEDSSKGTLHISVTNIKEFAEMVEQARKEADQLQKTINQLANFHLDVLISSGTNPPNQEV